MLYCLQVVKLVDCVVGTYNKKEVTPQVVCEWLDAYRSACSSTKLKSVAWLYKGDKVTAKPLESFMGWLEERGQQQQQRVRQGQRQQVSVVQPQPAQQLTQQHTRPAAHPPALQELMPSGMYGEQSAFQRAFGHNFQNA